MIEKLPAFPAPTAPNSEITILDTSDPARGASPQARAGDDRDEIPPHQPFTFEKRICAADARVALRVGDEVPRKFLVSARALFA